MADIGQRSAEQVASLFGHGEVNSIISRIATLEARFGGLEQKTDRIEALLQQILNKANESREASDARQEKLMLDKLEPLKDVLRADRAKIEGLEAGKRFNFATVGVVGALLFTIFTYYNAQQAESLKQLVASQSAGLKSEFIGIDSSTRTGVLAEIAQTKSDIAGIKSVVDKHSSEDIDYQNFKGLVTAQNSTSIADRAAQTKTLNELQAAAHEMSREQAGLIARVDQKFTEIETQFNADGQLRNIQFSDQQRLNAIHQNALHELGAKVPEYPEGPFYQPNVSQSARGQ